MQWLTALPPRHRAALDALVTKLRQDRYVLAAILYGSLARGEGWEKSDIDVMIVQQDGLQSVHRTVWLVENGVRVSAEVVARGHFKRWLEQSLPGTVGHAIHSQGRLLFSHDESIAAWLEQTERVGARDQALQLLADMSHLPYLLDKAAKWLYVRRDPDYCFTWILFAVNDVARLEVGLNGEAPRREVLNRAMAYNPTFFKAVHTGLIHGPKDEPSLQRVLDLLDAYLEERAGRICRPILDYLAEAGGPRTMSEIDDHFCIKMPNTTLEPVCDWLARKGIIHRAAAPLRLTRKSQVTFEEPAYYYDTLK